MHDPAAGPGRRRFSTVPRKVRVVTPRKVLCAAALSAAVFFVAPAWAAPPAEAAVAAVVDDVLARYALPGIAVGVVIDGEVRQLEFRGETVAGSGQPVQGDTLFKVASNTKAMTAALLARQVDAGLLAWDDPVVKHLPSSACTTRG